MAMGLGWVATQGLAFDLGWSHFHVWCVSLPSLVGWRIVPEILSQRNGHHVGLGHLPGTVGRVFVQREGLDL